MKPWFEKEVTEGDIIKFPEPEKKVIQMPNIASYPDFLTGVKDLQNRLSDGQISQESYDRLYAELIQRFMKKESFESPWFLREAPADAGIMGTQAATDFKSLGQQVADLPADTDPRLIDKIAQVISLARQPKEKEVDYYKNVSYPLKQIDDPDMQKAYSFVAKQMLGNNLSGDEMFKKIIPAIQQNKCINLKELQSLQSDLGKIVPLYNSSKQTAYFFTDLLMHQPGQRTGPGEILFSVFSKSITKGGKGDLTLSNGKSIEVKGADEATGSGAGRMRDSDVTSKRSPKYSALAQKFLKKFPTNNKTGWSLGKRAGVIGLINQQTNPKNKKILIDYAGQLVDAIFPQGGYAGELKQAIANGDEAKANYYFGLSNMQQYHLAKGGEGTGQAYLFVDTSKSPASTVYLDSFGDALAGLEKGVLKMKVMTPYLVAKPGEEQEIYPKISLYPVK